MVRFRRDKEVPEIALTISFETFVRVAIFIVLTLLLISVLKQAAHAMLLIFTAFFLALALNSPVSALAKRLPGRKRGSRAIATTLSLIIMLAALAGFIASFAPSLVNQTQAFVQTAPNIVQDFRDQNSDTGRFIRKYHLQDQVDDFSSQLSSRSKNIGGSAFAAAQRVGSSIFSLLTILVLTFMMLVEGPRWLTFTRKVLPDGKRELADRLANDMYRVIKGYVNGQVFLAALAALLILPILLILDISYPAALMVIVFVCGLIPMVGHTIGAIIVTIVALFNSVSAAALVLAYYFLYQQLENYLIQPRIQANTTNMSPLLVFASLVIGVSFGGLLGGLVAIPIAGCIRIALLEYLRSRGIIDTPQFKEITEGTK